MRRNWTLIGIISLMLTVTLAACDTAGGAVPAVENYLNALVAKDEAVLSTLSCAEWEMTALLELDSFQAVEVRMEGLSCEEAGKDGDITLVVCQGKIIATYNEEDQELDLSLRTYEVIEQGGENLVCGYR